MRVVVGAQLYLSSSATAVGEAEKDSGCALKGGIGGLDLNPDRTSWLLLVSKMQWR